MKHDITLIMTYDPFWAPQRTFQFLKVKFFFLFILNNILQLNFW